LPLTPLIAFDHRDYLVIEESVDKCYKDNKFCNTALFKINNYQKKSVKNKNFSCQTRLLGLEANLIMAMNYNLKKREAKSIIKTVKKYC
tara:strand:+ start:482 stop:748 length:267 start_codon:yes stop_codon:yes gene_type:complete